MKANNSGEGRFSKYDSVVDPILASWAEGAEPIHSYPAGSSGPAEATRLFLRRDERWRDDAPDQ